MDTNITDNLSFKIKISNWLRGEDNSCLCRVTDGKMCCLGQISEQAGIPKVKLVGFMFPSSLGRVYHDKGVLEEKIPFLLDTNLLNNSLLATKAIDINDNCNTDDEFKIKSLTELFATEGITLTFIP